MSENANPLSIPNVEGTITQDDKNFKSVASTRKFINRLQLLQGSTDCVKEDQTGKLRPGEYVYVPAKNKYDILGRTVDVYIIDWRPKALRLKNKKPEMQCFDPTNAIFDKIKNEADSKYQGDDPAVIIASMYGPEFLLYAPAAMGGAGAFTTHFMSSVTARNKAADVKALMGGPATLGSEFIKTAKHSWYGPTVVPCSSPLKTPDQDEFVEVLKIFKNPPKDPREIIEEPEEKVER